MVISICYLTVRGLYPFLGERMKHLGQYDVLAEALRASTFTDFEIVVVDKFNTTPRPELNWLGDRVTYAPFGETPWDALWAKNIPVGRNSALRAAHGEVILGLDDCVSFTPRLLQLVADHSSRGEYLAPALLNESNNASTGEVTWSRLGEWQDAAGGILAYPRRLALEVGGHEERFVGCQALEDWEFCQRMVRAGMVLVHDDRETVKLHRHGFKNAQQYRCSWEVYGLLRNQRTGNRKWSRAEYEHFAAPRCGFLAPDGTHCTVTIPPHGCGCRKRPTDAALRIMRDYETEVIDG